MTVHGVPLMPGKRVNTKLIHHPPGRLTIFIAVMIFVHGKSEFFYTQKRLFGFQRIRFLYMPKSSAYFPNEMIPNKIMVKYFYIRIRKRIEK